PFTTCTINGLPAGSLLLSATCIYDNLMNVDIGVTRAPFGSVPGLNQNGQGVAVGLESYYNVNLTGGAANMFRDLFLFGNAAIFGIDGGYVTNSAHDNQFGDRVKGSGAQVGLYGVYDPGAFFVKAVGTYSWLNGDATRHIAFGGLAPGATFVATPSGSPD